MPLGEDESYLDLEGTASQSIIYSLQDTVYAYPINTMLSIEIAYLYAFEVPQRRHLADGSLDGSLDIDVWWC